jgi:hypothetical protein
MSQLVRSGHDEQSVPPTPMHYVYDGRECVGFVLARGHKGHEALDREQRSLGLFKTAAAAANVVFNAAASERP